MKLILADIVNAWDPLMKLSERELPIKSAFRIGKVLKVISEERQLIENAKVKLFEKFGGPDPDNPGQIKVPDEKMKELLSEWNAFLSQPTEVNLEPLDEEFFNEISYINLTGRDVSFLLPLMKDYNIRHYAGKNPTTKT
jgi:hypothetical protein